MVTTTSLNKPTLQIGDQGTAVKELQTLINTYLGSILIVDGIFGAATKNAVRSVQVRVGLDTDGIANSTTWERLIFEILFAEKPIDLPDLYRGLKGDLVRWAQRRLAIAGYYSGILDGDFGSRTEIAVKNFQANQHLTADGVIGKKTWKALGKIRQP